MEPDEVMQSALKQSDSNLKVSFTKIALDMVNTFKANLSRAGIRMRTGELERSIKVESISDTEVKVIADVDYASYVDEGTPKMPAREFMKSTPELEKEIEQIIEDAIIKAFK